MNFKKILLAVDASENAMRAVEYTGNIAGNAQGFEVQILCIERLPHRDLYPDENTWKEGCEETRTEMKAFMSTARERLVELGMSGLSISEHYVTSCISPFTDTDPKCSRGDQRGPGYLGSPQGRRLRHRGHWTPGRFQG